MWYTNSRIEIVERIFEENTPKGVKMETTNIANAHTSSPAVSAENPIQERPEVLKATIAANIASLRRARGMTQMDLAERLNYTDKAVSKWERGESIPDVIVLKRIADLFDVTVDSLLTPAVKVPETKLMTPNEAHNIRTRGFVTGISILLVWLVATVIFTILETIPLDMTDHWLIFAYAVPASLIVWLVLNSIWFNRRRNYLIISLLMWTVIALAYIAVWRFAGRYLWMAFLLGIPGQAIIILWSRLKKLP